MQASQVQQAITTAKSTQQNMTARGTADNRELGKQDFLNLLMTQLANQDPTDPMKPEQMMQQMAGQQQGLNQQGIQLALGQMAATAQQQMMQQMLQIQQGIRKSLDQA